MSGTAYDGLDFSNNTYDFLTLSMKQKKLESLSVRESQAFKVFRPNARSALFFKLAKEVMFGSDPLDLILTTKACDFGIIRVLAADVFKLNRKSDHH
jgi:hypothetical protein